MADGEYSTVDVPLKAIESQEIIYQMSKAYAVTEPVSHNILYDQLTYKFDVVKGVEGQYDVQMDSGGEPKKLTYTQLTANLLWYRYNYMINDSSKLNSREPQDLWDSAARSGAEYFAAVQDYQTLTVLAAGAGNNHTAANYWDSDDGDPEKDIVTALGKITANSNIAPGETMSVIMPAKAAMELEKLNLIQNVQQKMTDYLEGSFDIKLIPYRPYIKGVAGAETAVLDALDNDVIVCVNGRNTVHFAQYDPAVAAASNVTLVEHSRIHGRGDYYTQKAASISRVVWDKIDSTNTKSNRIYKIADVVSAAL